MGFFKYALETLKKDLPRIVGGDFLIQKAYEAASTDSWNLNDCRQYDAKSKRERDLYASFAWAHEQRTKEGRAKAREELEEEAKNQAVLKKTKIV